MKEVQAFHPTRTALLVLSCRERKARLAAVLTSLGVESDWVRKCRAARRRLRPESSPAVVITDVTLHDANWSDVVRVVVGSGAQANIVVVAPPSADEALWSEVLWRGAHDMLVEPFTETEARRVLESALRASDHSRQFAAAQTRGPF